MSNDDQSWVDHMSLSRFFGESKANLVDDADNIQSGAHESSTLIILTPIWRCPIFLISQQIDGVHQIHVFSWLFFQNWEEKNG